MKMNKLALACGVALLGASAVAQAELSGNIGVTSNYMFRGISLTNDDPAISGGLDYAADSGFYIGTWASSLSNSTEVDGYLGYGGEVGDFGYDVGVIRYFYPDHGNADFDYTELYANVSYEMFEGGIAYTVESGSANSGSTFDEGDIYYYIGASTDIINGFSLGATAGYYDWDNDNAAGVDSYGHVDVTVSKDVGDLGEFSFLVSKAGKGANGDTDPNFAVSWTKTF
jgi:uncharacterized protein (TIGR02001 family)